MTEQQDGIFTSEENEILTENRRLRQMLIGILTKDETGKTRVPGSTSDKVLLDSLLNGVDKEITTRAKLRVATKANDTTANLLALATSALTSHKVPARRHATPEERTMPDNIVVDNPIAGETTIGVKTFELNDILKDD